eukprot:gene19014-25605_t
MVPGTKHLVKFTKPVWHPRAFPAPARMCIAPRNLAIPVGKSPDLDTAIQQKQALIANLKNQDAALQKQIDTLQKQGHAGMLKLAHAGVLVLGHAGALVLGHAGHAGALSGDSLKHAATGMEQYATIKLLLSGAKAEDEDEDGDKDEDIWNN